MRTIAIGCVLLSALWTACGDGGGDDAGMVAPDAGTPDSGVPTFACGERACVVGEQYCLIEPVGACTATDGGACAATEEPCQASFVTGCTPSRDRTCTALPEACSTCACLVGEAPCSGAVSCARQGEGLALSCPFP